MRTYDQGARSHGTGFSWRHTRARLARWFDREREIITLRNVVGMISEARRGDAEEYEAMAAALRQAREILGSRYQGRLTEVNGIGRLSDTPQALVVYFADAPTDDDLRNLHDLLRPR